MWIKGMKIGVPKEQKSHEFRVGATPELVDLLVKRGHSVTVQSSAGEKIGFTDELYRQAGAELVDTLEAVYQADLILKVKAPERVEYPLLRRGQLLFCFLHLASDKELVAHLIERKVIAVAFEMVRDREGRAALLAPMSEIAGQLAVWAAARGLEIPTGGKGLLMGKIAGIAPPRVCIIGAGVAGSSAMELALSLNATTTAIDVDTKRLKAIESRFSHRVTTLFSTPKTIEEELQKADVVIAAPLIPGRKTPKLITDAMVKRMERGSVLIDISIDQGGCSETSRLSHFDNPYYEVHGVVHYAVSNMPSACAKSSSYALSNALSPYVSTLADQSVDALLSDHGLHFGVQLALGHPISSEVDIDLPRLSLEQVLAAVR